MSFAQDNGYTPLDFNTLMNFVREGVNTQFSTAYSVESFVGTNWYKYAYVIIQRVLRNETKTSEIFQKLQQFIRLTNEKIQRPSVSLPGLLDSFTSRGYLAAVKPPEDADAGKIFIAVDLNPLDDDFADQKIEIAGLIKDFVAAGLVSQGTQVTAVTLSNGQSFDFKFNTPTRIPVLLRLTAEISENTLIAVPDDEELRQKIFDQVNARYRLGFNFEPQRYFTLSDAPWAGEVELEWSDDAGATWHQEVYQSEYDELFTFDLEDIEVVVS